MNLLKTLSSLGNTFLITFVLLCFTIVSIAGCKDDFFTDDIALGVDPDAEALSSSASDSDGDIGSDELDDDADGIGNEVEATFEIDPLKADSDHDGYSDGLEFVVNSGDPLNASANPVPLNLPRFLLPEETINDIDSDQDGLGDVFETSNALDPEDPDMDDDGYRDGLELIAQSDPFSASSRPIRNAAPTSDGITRSGSAPRDTDLDGIADEFEAVNGTSSSARDSDNDGFDDGIEFIMGSDGNDSRSVPNFSVPLSPDL